MKEQNEFVALWMSIAATTVAIGMATFYELTSLRWMKR
jgi:hypothetical protein